MINHPRKPSIIWEIEQIKDRIHSGNYDAEFLLMHLCHRYDELEAEKESWKSDAEYFGDHCGRYGL